MSEWKCYKLNEISSLSNGINFDKSAYTSGVKLIGVSDFKNRIHPDYDSLQEVDSKVVKSGDYLEKGDIVFVRSNGNKELVGRCMIIDRDIPVTYSGFCINLRLKDKKRFEPVFFNYLFSFKFHTMPPKPTILSYIFLSISDKRFQLEKVLWYHPQDLSSLNLIP